MAHTCYISKYFVLKVCFIRLYELCCFYITDIISCYFEIYEDIYLRVTRNCLMQLRINVLVKCSYVNESCTNNAAPCREGNFRFLKIVNIKLETKFCHIEK